MLTVRTFLTVVPLSLVLADLSASAQVPIRPGTTQEAVRPNVPRPSAQQLQTMTRAQAQRPSRQQAPAPPPPQQQQQQSNEERRQAARAKGRFQLDFNKADIADVVQTISDFTGKLFIVPDNLRGKITIVGPEDGTGLVTADEAYAAFLSALEANNWTVYPVGKYLKLVEKRAAATSNVWTYLDDSTPIPDDERTVTKVIRLSHVDTDTIANPIKQLMSKDASLIPMPPDTLIVTEVSLNLRRIERIIDALDQPGGGEEMRVIQVEYATATELAEKLLQVFESQDRGGAGGRRGGAAARPAAVAAEGAGGEATPASISRVIPDERTNKLIVIANRKAFEQIDALIKQLDVPTGDTGRINVYYLENANAEDLAATLQSLTTGTTGATAGRQRRGAQAAAPQAAELFSGEVKISADKATNSLVVVASAQDYKNLVKVIERLDIPRRQVFVEAVIMEVNLRDTTDFGFSVHGGGSVNTADGIAPIVVGNQVGSASSLNLSSLVSLGGFLAGIQGPPIGAAAELGVALPSFGVVMHALTKNSDVNVLSTPHILTSDNEEAEITVGQNVPFQAGFAPQGIQNLFANAGSTNAATGLVSGALGSGFGLGSFFAPIQRQNVELKLKIKPQINESDYIRMTVEEQTEEIAEQDPVLGPTTAKRTAKTVVVARDQTTVVIGGLIQERTIKSVSKTPVLGDIPVLGWLFRESSTTKVKTNLLLFLTPYIIRDQSDFRRIFERKMREREEFIAAFYGTSSEYEVPIDYARKAGPVAILSRDVRQEMQKVENGGPGAPGEMRIQPRRRDWDEPYDDDWHRQQEGPSDWHRPEEEGPAGRPQPEAAPEEAPAGAPEEPEEAPAEAPEEGPADDRGNEEDDEPQQPTDDDEADAGTD